MPIRKTHSRAREGSSHSIHASTLPHPPPKQLHDPLSHAIDATLLALSLLYIFFCPYTKVEESFNIQAIHDLLIHGAAPSGLSHFDHLEFPGAVPRTFIGAVALAAAAWPLKIICISLLGLPKIVLQYIVRALLGTFTVVSLRSVRLATQARYGVLVGRWFALLCATQFHLLFWGSRTIPNTFAMGLWNLALARWVALPQPHTAVTWARESDGVAGTRELSKASKGTGPVPTSDPKTISGIATYSEPIFSSVVSYLALAAIVFRAEIAALAAPIIVMELVLTRRATFFPTLRAGVTASTISILATVTIDSFFWRRWLWPEAASFVFNAVEGKNAEWGIHPWWYYGVLVPRIATLALPLAAYAAYRIPPSRLYLLPAALFVTIYSVIGHKEWRFVQYVVPVLNLTGAMGLEHIHEQAGLSLRVLRHESHPSRTAPTGPSNRNRKRYAWTFVAALFGLTISAVFTVFSIYVSSLNYPGGYALARFHRIFGVPQSRLPHLYVHMDVLTCMTGATRFGELWSESLPARDDVLDTKQNENGTTEVKSESAIKMKGHWRYSKNETHKDAKDFEAYSHVLTEDPRILLWTGKWKAVDVVSGYTGLDVVVAKMKWWKDLMQTITSPGVDIRGFMSHLIEKAWPLKVRVEEKIWLLKKIEK
ncbi:glycosyltransferase family 22 protein [Gonapodya prolifera JEL478]|uniref:Mannosyltransferase n=1 Tax=Gonapodya prolifera (strain JEL478) TaxID=1344416 RepID=A0A139ASZ6_GONPJ|nr:glycosyltransferase family 22 protein [Gonapodya prolifera JEL478]|eukprot:KXS19794.1 glycosyltransferase family 22 protein [Gonapodya prolifera JEL478]